MLDSWFSLPVFPLTWFLEYLPSKCSCSNISPSTRGYILFSRNAMWVQICNDRLHLLKNDTRCVRYETE
ncbi:unnamed protein product [Acanthoscelides obtectus]|uniref:Uncharacterized protein n=1 Tax=Acanthoscelides obtectus TaxID=200917 RepID=A0A9P0LWW1_ACAOB|nr:unnamed protein product [Acanthoscelides obtectus]CAH2004188.1 unnamed protein product [Acanthoscelides obtectus]CAK1625143.1 hypothetical protein AOBTE_LOCUS2987 [Acanthoscelides obtectus]CAK1625153.1 hypothetical protein AOBTE_LOCUS2995 [Acanthoscelides obtectus]